MEGRKLTFSTAEPGGQSARLKYLGPPSDATFANIAEDRAR